MAAACFGPNLTLLVTSTDDSAILSSVPLQESLFNVKKSCFSDLKEAVPLLDLQKINFATDDDYVTVGGRVVAMEWDPTGRYLAILSQVQFFVM